MISQKLKIEIKMNAIPAYKIAQRAGIDPSVLSKLLCGIVPIKPMDERILSVGKVLGIPATECFEKEDVK